MTGAQTPGDAAAVLAEQRQRIAHEGIPYMPPWAGLSPAEQDQAVREAAHWLNAAERAGLLTKPEPMILMPEPTPEQAEELTAMWKANPPRPGRLGRGHHPTVLPPFGITRERVRAAAHALFEWNNELPGDPRFTLHHVTGGVDREPYGALVDEVLHHLGITVQEGQPA